MGSSSSKRTVERNAVQFRVYSFWGAGESYPSCLTFADTTSELFDKVAVTQLNDDITFVACYRVKPYNKEDIDALTAMLKIAVGSDAGELPYFLSATIQDRVPCRNPERLKI
ncbi:hypothetical protein IAU59_005602 [Kwoniella sp. CBS 9459]